MKNRWKKMFVLCAATPVVVGAAAARNEAKAEDARGGNVTIVRPHLPPRPAVGPAVTKPPLVRHRYSYSVVPPRSACMSATAHVKCTPQR
jgi:hypothetical protein